MGKAKLAMLATTSVVMLAVVTEANALTVANPFGNDPIIAVVGHNLSVGPVICYNNRRTFQQRAFSLGTLAGLNDNYNIQGGSDNDDIKVVSELSQFECGFTLEPLVYNGFRLDVNGLDGADIVRCGSGRSACFGNGGNDTMFAFSPTDRVNGGSNNDKVVGTSAVTTDRLEGDSGNDCLTDPGNQHSVFNCGSGTDKFVAPASGRVGCETQVSSCG
jgi:Ca2+-binding RTX toxin-like protein